MWIKGGLNLILFNLRVFTLWPEVHKVSPLNNMTQMQAYVPLLSLIYSVHIAMSHTATQTYHSSGRGYTVCLRALSGSYSKDTPAVGFHLACSFPNPFLAYALSRSSWPLRSFTTKISALWSQQSCFKTAVKLTWRQKHPGKSFTLTILFNIVIGIVVPTPGCHLKSPEEVHCLPLPLTITVQ